MKTISHKASCLLFTGLLVFLVSSSMLHAQKRGTKTFRSGPRFEQPMGDTITVRCDPEQVIAATVIQYTLPMPGKVSVRVLNESGHEVATLDNQKRNAGQHQVIFDRRDLPAGTYSCSVQLGTVTVTKKLLLLARPE